MPSHASRRGPFRALSASTLEGTTPPTEFRLFARGAIETSKGTFIFDNTAALSVLAAAKKQGHRYALDLEHGALEPGGRSDAMCYFNVALRNGELFAVNCKWTPEGIERLASRKQIFVSPAFSADDNNRVVELFNAALTSVPATFNSQELVAASRKGPLTRAGSTVVRARVLKADAAKFVTMARASQQTPGEALRVLVMSAVHAAELGPDTLQKIASVLGLKGASDAEIASALQALIDEFGLGDGATGADPLDGGGAAEQPPAGYQLTASERAEVVKNKMNAEQIERFTMLCAKRVKERAEQKKKGT